MAYYQINTSPEGAAERMVTTSNKLHAFAQIVIPQFLAQNNHDQAEYIDYICQESSNWAEAAMDSARRGTMTRDGVEAIINKINFYNETMGYYKSNM